MSEKTINISIFGLGYVGCVSLGCLAQNGHKVIGVDILPEKIELINRGKATIIEKDIDHIISEQHKKGNIKATSDYYQSVLDTDVSIICVGTPSAPEGHLDLSHIYQTAQQIGNALSEKKSFHIIAIRSTVMPGTNKKVCEIIEERSGKKRNSDFAIVSNPEFLREGSAVEDYYNPPLTVLGSNNSYALEVMESIYQKVNGPIEIVTVEVAELIKYVNNSFHALKVVFANEIGNICKSIGIDSHEVMRIFCMDTQLNISPYYLKPGFAYGGSCLPKDLKALKTVAHDLYIETPVINSIDNSNELQKKRAFELIVKTGKRKIGILGLSFKAGTDDLRNSPIVEVIEKLSGKGYEIRIYDKNVSVAQLIGKNKSYIEKRLPHIKLLLWDNLNDIVNWAELFVIANNDEKFSKIEITNKQHIIDLVRIDSLKIHPEYNGLCW